MKKLLCIIALLCSFAHAQIIEHQISDDGYVRVPLQFAFPYYGRVFTESYMFSNGVVGFLNPTNSWCCTGFDLRTNNGTPFNFAIMPLQTDLLNYSGRFLTEGTPQYQRYVWENISEFGRPENLNTFGVEIRPSGYIGMHYEKVNISPERTITIGMTGDTALGEYTQYYHGAGYSTSTPFSYITESTGNICVTNPLSSPTCPGYQEALLVQQCTISSLYSPQCPDYEKAYLAQQCDLSPLYDKACKGYEEAYFNQQCSIDALYNTKCNGYEAAYFNQQCLLNPLYNQGCTGYAEAYFTYQCTQSPLYDRTCSGYAEAYALKNIVTPKTIVASPTVQLSTTGTISVETPIIADTVVNEVITKPAPIEQTKRTSEPVQTSQMTSQPEKKEEKKDERKEVKPQTRTLSVQPKPVETAVGIAPSIKVADIPKGFDIIDHSHKKLIANLPSIRENRRILWMSNDSDKKHREMVDGQWSR